MIEDMIAAGIPAEQHLRPGRHGAASPQRGRELAELVGDPWVLENVRVENHFARNDADHVDLGSTPTRGTPVKIDRRLVEADLQDRHRAGRAAFHGRLFGRPQSRRARRGACRHDPHIPQRALHGGPAGAQCNLEGNPLHEEQLEIVRMIGEV